ncbi:hypothetical protein PY257_06840 [Ramlibacter sp. H39-3-26]|uniref:hypothetical protein n=1 Tax=Curvibacter soli TaxID=3031331 RepID=UPI0023DA7CE1|nr:hypothetical protein [Ramlibacter sp. H39-3-26]MDF1484904.1 hypothetical protein [Ramlibacter sp. H39-3-26]
MQPHSFSRAALLRVVFCAAALAGTAAQAQSTPAAPAGDGSRGERMRETLHKRFGAADANTDGHLTRDEAKDKMPWVYKNFDAIDASHGGSVTMADIEAYMARQRAGRRAATK